MQFPKVMAAKASGSFADQYLKGGKRRFPTEGTGEGGPGDARQRGQVRRLRQEAESKHERTPSEAIRAVAHRDPVLLAGLCWQFPAISRPIAARAMQQSQSGCTVRSKAVRHDVSGPSVCSGRRSSGGCRERRRDDQKEPAGVRTKFGRTVGGEQFILPGSCRGVGRVVTADADSIGLSVSATGDEADVVVPLDFVFGNAVRDAPGCWIPAAIPTPRSSTSIVRRS
jgi:hypothetical protein